MWNKKLNEKIDKINDSLEKTNFLQWSYILGSRKEIFKRNFLAGIARGLGMTVGVTIITAIVIYILQKMMVLNIPLIGEYITELVRIVEKNK